MLVLSRKSGEVIHIGSDIRIVVLKVGGNRVRIGIEAPTDLLVLRGELLSHELDTESTELASNESKVGT